MSTYIYVHTQADYLSQVLLGQKELQDVENVHVVLDFSMMAMTEYNGYELIFNRKHQFLKIELDQIIKEIWKYILVHEKNIIECHDLDNINQDTLSKLYFDIWWPQTVQETLLNACDPNQFLFGKLADFDLIPPNTVGKSYHVAVCRDFVIDPSLKPKYKKHFGIKPCDREKCKQSNASCTCKPHKGATPPCSKLADNGKCPIWKKIHKIDNGTSTKVITDKSQQSILKHLSNYDHFEYFNKKQPMCKDGNKCSHYLNVLNGNSSNFKDKIHLHLYFHKPSKNEQIMMIDTDQPDSKNHGIFEYLPHPNDIFQPLNDTLCIYTPNYQLFLLIQEVIQNNFIQDLNPKRNAHDRIKPHFTSSLLSNVDVAIQVCKKEFAIFDELEEKMQHERCKQCLYYLPPAYILALLLYCNGSCNYDLCKSQIDGSYQTKWQCFDGFLNLAIAALGAGEMHYENLYSGLCNVKLDIKKLYLNTQNNLKFKTTVSFSSDINVAKEFRGAEGIILGLNMSRDTWYNRYESFSACDVSWLSKYPTETEVVVARRSTFRIMPSQSMQIGKNQYVVLHNSDASFQKMFLM